LDNLKDTLPTPLVLEIDYYEMLEWNEWALRRLYDHTYAKKKRKENKRILLKPYIVGME